MLRCKITETPDRRGERIRTSDATFSGFKAVCDPAKDEEIGRQLGLLASTNCVDRAIYSTTKSIERIRAGLSGSHDRARRASMR
jgi:hypothetical protein